MNARCAVLATLLALSCNSYSVPSDVVNGVVVITQFTPGTTWGSYLTYSVDPSVAVVDETGAVTVSCSVDGSQLVPTIESNMNARGYENVPFGEAADIEIKMDALLGSVNTYVPGYCGWYPYYYCYPGWTYTGSYSFGTLVLTMGDTKNATPGGKLPLLWTNADYGVLAAYFDSGCTGSGTSVNWVKIRAAIDQAFSDSPYIVRP